MVFLKAQLDGSGFFVIYRPASSILRLRIAAAPFFFSMEAP